MPVSHVTITEPNHPLFGRTLPVVRAPTAFQMNASASLVIKLPNGEHRQVPCSVTDLAKPGLEEKSLAALLLPISARTLLPLAHHVRRLRSATEESADETPAEPTDCPIIDATPERDNGVRPISGKPWTQHDANNWLSAWPS